MSYFPRAICCIRFEEVIWPGGMEYVPAPLEEAVLEAVQRVADRFGITLDGSEQNSAAIQEAVEDSLIPMQMYLEWAEAAQKFARVARKEERLYAAVSGELFLDPEYEQEDEITLEALAVYQLDSLIAATRAKNLTRVLCISTDIFEIQKLLGRREKLQEFSALAAERAKKRHQHTNAQKAELLKDWVTNGHGYESRADFVRIMSDLKGIKYRTLYEWIAHHDKEDRDKW
ncbi:hypothetical protein [Pseudomonas syringae]|uniref:hypothetical protein n=1 Tax=Pseudomonas syringae TaxID=317 RepID=UPI0006E70152|nr:hypothetical protein [Pseudomonas syringae]KPZ34750.1 hypothetical protein AN901_203575 [Pseudomonas syringae pv. theae]GKQ32682.1 hypothetical protein PSTH68_24205 [Pseudomonas syringae pv. theae]